MLFRSGPRLKVLFDSGRKPADIIEELYLTILSRFPTADELKNAEAYGQAPPAKTAKPTEKAAPKKREDWVDLAWSLINSTEFLYRH